ncbi:MAG: polysaccharide deacetylase family protein [Motiliproteus sp.]
MLHQLLTLLSTPINRNKLSILNYHQVLPQLDPMRPWEPDTNKFDWQMSLLQRYFTPLSINEALDRIEAGTLPPKAVCVTLDDGYLNNLEFGLPILERYQIPATVFVASAFSQGDNMWNDRIIDLIASTASNAIDLNPVGLGNCVPKSTSGRRQLAARVIQQLKYLPINERLEKVDALYAANYNAQETRKMMLPEEISQLSRAGIEIGGHTHNHPILKEMDYQQQLEEVSQNKALLEQWTSRPVTGFAYPNGRLGKDMDEDGLAVVEQLGFRYAVSTDAGYTSKGSNPFALKRFTPWDGVPLKFHTRMVLNLMTKSAAI